MKNTLKFNFDEEAKKCKTVKDLMGGNGLLKKITKQMLEQMLQAEMEEHLGYAKHEKKGKDNNRNGTTSKSIRSTYGEIDIEVPRDRNSTFDPMIVKKNKRDISEFDNKIISMYAKGMTTRDIQDHIQEMYGIEISPTMVSMITDKVESLVVEWQNRPLSEVYAVCYFDAIHYKVRENGKILSKAAYTCLGINMEGKKEILGIWIGENEGARFWVSVFNELRARGAKDILIACMDGLKGMPDALKAVFPEAITQLCIVHMIRNSLKFVASKYQKEFITDLKLVYQAPSETIATQALESLNERWGKRYPLAVNPWFANWQNLCSYFSYPYELRRMVYTTNAVEAVHRQLRKVTKNRSVMPNDTALLKLLFLAGRDVQKKWTTAARGWGDVISQLHIIFGDRVMAQ